MQRTFACRDSVPGKAPPAIVKKRFKDAIRQQVIESLVQEAFQEVMDREKLKVASQPHVHDLKFEDGQPLSFELHVEIRPDVELARTQGFRVTRPQPPVTDDSVREQIEQIRDQKATWTPVEDKPRRATWCACSSRRPTRTANSPRRASIRSCSAAGQAIPGVEELIMEITPGETPKQSVRWPDDFPDEAQRGKTKPVRVHLLDVKRKSLPALDDAFAREVGDFESLDALNDDRAKGSRGTRGARGRRRRAPAARRPDRRGESFRRSAELGQSAHRRLRCRRIRCPKRSATSSAPSSARSPSVRFVAI